MNGNWWKWTFFLIIGISVNCFVVYFSRLAWKTVYENELTTKKNSAEQQFLNEQNINQWKNQRLRIKKR